MDSPYGLFLFFFKGEVGGRVNLFLVLDDFKMQMRAVLVFLPRRLRYGRNHVPLFHFLAHAQIVCDVHETVERLHAVAVIDDDFRARQYVVAVDALHHPVVDGETKNGNSIYLQFF